MIYQFLNQRLQMLRENFQHLDNTEIMPWEELSWRMRTFQYE